MKNFKAFTLAETMIVLVILGIVAAITIPALVRRHVESSNRTRIKKAMSVYDTAINKMVVENGIKSNDALINEFNADHNNNSCAKSRAYFKSAQDGANDCTFRASDGVWWNISDINHPIIAFNEDDLTDEIASGDTNKAFHLVGYLDNNGSLRVGDLAVAEGDNQEYLTKLYNFVNNIKEEADPDIALFESLKDCSISSNPHFPCYGGDEGIVLFDNFGVHTQDNFVGSLKVCEYFTDLGKKYCEYKGYDKCNNNACANETYSIVSYGNFSTCTNFTNNACADIGYGGECDEDECCKTDYHIGVGGCIHD